MSGRALRLFTTGFTLELVSDVILALWCWVHGSPAPGTSLIHLVPPAISFCQVPFVRRDIHAAVSTLIALTIRCTHVGDGATATIQPWTADAHVLRSQTWRRRGGTRKLNTLVRKLQRLRKRDANGIVGDNGFSE